MNRKYYQLMLSGALMALPFTAKAHTNSVGFQSSTSAVTTCVGGTQTPCYDVEVFYGTWHANANIPPEGDLALWRQDSGGGETQVVGQTAGGPQIPFTTMHSLTGAIPNSATPGQFNYSAVGSADIANLMSVFTLGTNYFFDTASGTLGTVAASGVYSHQSAVSVGLAPGNYRIDYDAATSGSLSARWAPQASVRTATFTLLPDGTVTVPSAAPPSVALTTMATDPGSPFTTTVTFSEPITGLTLSDFVVGNGTASSLVMVSPGVYTILVTPSDPAADVTVDLPASTVIDGDSNGNFASNQLSLSAVPSVALSTPSTTYSGPFTVTSTFSEPVSGLTLSDFVVGNGTVSGLVMVSADVYTVLVTPTDNSLPVTVNLPSSTVIDADSNANSASNTLGLSSAPGLGAATLAAVQDVIITEATNDLRRQLAANRRFMRGARERLIAGRRCRVLTDDDGAAGAALLEIDAECRDDLVSRNNIPFDITGSLVASSKGLDLRGGFFGQEGSADGSHRRLVYGDFDVTGYEGGSVTGTFSGRIAWEREKSAEALSGVFLGAELSRSQIAGAFSGTRDTIGLSAGAYYVEQIKEKLYGDAFISIGAGLNNLDIGDGTVDVTGNYVTTSLQAGAALTGELNYENFDVFPEISAMFGLTRIGDVGVTGTTLGLAVSDTVEAGVVSLAVLRFTPRVEIPLDINSDVYDEKSLAISPSVMCEIVRSTATFENCGFGVELELSARAFENDQRVGGRVSFETAGGVNHGSFGLFYERSF